MAARLLIPAMRRIARPLLFTRVPTSQRTMVMVTKTAVGSLPDMADAPSAPAPPPIVTHDIKVSQSCINRILALVRKRTDGVTLQDIYLRVFVDAGGCSGFQYKFDLSQDRDEPIDLEEDLVYQSDGARVVIDKSSLDLIRGSTIDFTQEMIKSSFAVTNNPQSESACGCGSSFAMKNFSANPALD